MLHALFISSIKIVLLWCHLHTLYRIGFSSSSFREIYRTNDINVLDWELSWFYFFNYLTYPCSQWNKANQSVNQIKIKCITKNLLFQFRTDKSALQIYIPYQCILNKIILNIKFKVLWGLFYIKNNQSSVLKLATKIQEVQYLLLDSPWSITPS